MDLKMKKSHWVLLMLVVVVGYVAYTGDYFGGEGPGGGLIPSPQPQPEPEPTEEHGSASLQWTMRDAIGGGTLTSANEYVNTCIAGSDGTFDLTDLKESTDNSATQENTDTTFPEGCAVIIQCTSDQDLGSTGTDHYDGWFYIEELKVGNPVRAWSPSLMEVDHVDSDGIYHYRFKSGVAGETVDTVQWNAGDTPYWNLGVLHATPRAAGDDITFSAVYKSTSLSSITDGSTWDTTTTGAADAALTDDEETIDLNIDADATNIAYGLPMYTLTNKGKIETRPAFLIVSTNMTAIGSDAFTSDEWHKVEAGTLYAEVAFYKVIDPIVPVKGESFSAKVDLPIDATAAAASSGFYFKVWLIDFQLEENVRAGSPSTSIPVAQGFIYEFGIDAVIYARAFAASSGAGANQVLSWVLDTAA
jgi:hypothetical protein